jgi:uncharacterized protein
MKHSVLALLLVAALGLFALSTRAEDAPASAENPEAKRADVRKLLEISGTGAMGKQAAEQMITQFRTSMPNVQAEFWDEFQKEIDPNKLTEMCIPPYEKHLSHAEVKELIKFYESPIGQKLVKVQPQIMQECMVIGQQWGQEIGQKVVAKLQEKGIK